MGYNEYPGILREPLSNYENTFEYLQGLNDHSVQTALSRAIKSANAVSSILSINDGGFLPWVVDQVEDTMKDKALATGWKIKNIIFSNYDEEKEKPAEAFVKDIGKQLFWAGLTFLKGAVIGASTGIPFTLPITLVVSVLVFFQKQDEYEQMKKDQWLTGRLMANLQKCREKAAKMVLEKRAKTRAIENRVYQYGEKEFAVIYSGPVADRTVKVTASNRDTVMVAINYLKVERPTGIDGGFLDPDNAWLMAEIYVKCWDLMQKFQGGAGYKEPSLAPNAKEYYKKRIENILSMATVPDEPLGNGPQPSTQVKFMSELNAQWK